ncbi:MAG: hypothetical protein ACP5K9_02770 [Candidatus Micrarchaeia archaeon]
MGIDLDDVMSDLEAREARSSSQHHVQEKVRIGVVERFYDKLGVAAIRLEGELSIGDTIEIGDESASIRQKVESMQINRNDVQSAEAGDDVGIKLKWKVEQGSAVYKV